MTPLGTVEPEVKFRRDEKAYICKDSKGNPEPDPELRDYENVPLREDINSYFDGR